MTDRRRKGLQARDRGYREEQVARDYLQARGLRCLGSNVRTRAGELDLVMQEGDCLVFVEVRFRSRPEWGGALASITTSKQRRLIRAAESHLQRHPWPGPCRIDVVALDGQGEISWIRNAVETR